MRDQWNIRGWASSSMVRCMPHKHGAITSKAMHGGETGGSMRLTGQKALPFSNGELQANERPCLRGGGQQS